MLGRSPGEPSGQGKGFILRFETPFLGGTADGRRGSCILDGGVPYFTDMAQRPELRRTNRVFAEAESGDGGPGATPMREDDLGAGDR